MRYRTFGKTGWKISEIGFGAWAIGGKGWGPQKDDESMAALARALDVGVTFIDTAQGYGDGHSEKLIGGVLAARVAHGVRVLTKIPPMPGTWPSQSAGRLQGMDVSFGLRIVQPPKTALRTTKSRVRTGFLKVCIT